ncbi:TPA: FMN-binding protein [Candidatus Poribacteria bacterium]|nr:FMN-binding protein [Candidatus Poribacteria bacterium]
MKGKIWLNMLFILILGALSGLLLSGVESFTRDRIKQHQDRRRKAAVLEAAGINYEEDKLDEVFEANIRVMRKAGFEYYLSPNDLYIFEFKGRGLWGMIEGVIALNPDLETLENIRIVSQEETPGLGGRISEEWFLNKFKKKRVSPKLRLVLRRKATGPNEIDAITGATMTSQALIDMINESVANFREVLGRER